MPRSPPRHGQQRVNAEARENQKEYNRTKRTGQAFYNSGRWRRLRNWHAKNNPLCEHCKKEGRIMLMDVVDHIIEIKDGGELFDGVNLQSLCAHHHAIKTAASKEKRSWAN